MEVLDSVWQVARNRLANAPRPGRPGEERTGEVTQTMEVDIVDIVQDLTVPGDCTLFFFSAMLASLRAWKRIKPLMSPTLNAAYLKHKSDSQSGQVQACLPPRRSESRVDSG